MWYLLFAQYDGVQRPDFRGIRVISMMPTMKHCIDNDAALMEQELDGPWRFLLRGRKLSDCLNLTRRRLELPGGSWLQFFGAKTAQSARGLRADVGTFDECDDIPEEQYGSVAIPWFSEPFSLNMRWNSGTPRKGRHGLLHKSYQLGQLVGPNGEKVHPNLFSSHATYRDAHPHINLAMVEQARVEMPPEAFKREWECDFDAAEGLVYSTFLEKFHIRPPRKDAYFSEIIVGVDHGWEDPGVILVVGVMGNGREAVCHVIEEVYQQHETQTYWSEQMRRLRDKYRNRAPSFRCYADPSQPSNIEMIRRDSGVRIEGANNAIEDGVTAVQDRIMVRTRGKGDSEEEFARLYVDPSCKNTIREFGVYRRKRDPQNRERVLDDIEDKNNHAMDALRYAIFSRFGKPTSSRIELA
jgi:hypothetical protein